MEPDGKPRGRKLIPVYVGSVYRLMMLRFAIGGTVGLLLTAILFTQGIGGDYNLELWILTGFLFSVSLLVSVYSWRWLYLRRKKRERHSEEVDPPAHS